MEDQPFVPDLERVSRRSDGTYDFNKMMQVISMRPRAAMRWMQDRIAQLLKDPEIERGEIRHIIRVELKQRPWEDPSPA